MDEPKSLEDLRWELLECASRTIREDWWKGVTVRERQFFQACQLEVQAGWSEARASKSANFS